MGNVIPLFGEADVAAPDNRLTINLANMLFAAAEFCRTGIDAEDAEAVKLAQTVIVQIREFEENRHAPSPL